MSAIQTSFFFKHFFNGLFKKRRCVFCEGCCDGTAHPSRISWMLMMFFSSILLFIISNSLVLLGAHWTARLGQTKRQNSRVLCVVFLMGFLSLSVFLFPFLLNCSWKETFSASSETGVCFWVVFFLCACFCWSLLSELKLPLHIQKSPLMCHFEARHSESVSLATERWFLHSGWPPRAAGCWQIAVGWQIRSCAPLICTVGPLALLCFVSQSLNSADDRRQPGTGWAIVVSRRFLESLSSCPKCVFTCNVWSCVFTKWSLLWFLSPSPSDSSNPYP